MHLLCDEDTKKWCKLASPFNKKQSKQRNGRSSNLQMLQVVEAYWIIRNLSGHSSQSHIDMTASPNLEELHGGTFAIMHNGLFGSDAVSRTPGRCFGNTHVPLSCSVWLETAGKLCEHSASSSLTKWLSELLKVLYKILSSRPVASRCSQRISLKGLGGLCHTSRQQIPATWAAAQDYKTAPSLLWAWRGNIQWTT